MRRVRDLIRPLLRRAGLDVVRYDSTTFFEVRRLETIRDRGISLVVDVGASVGQYASELREAGYGGRIVSFEPDPDAFAKLVTRCSGDDLWSCRRLALGDRDGTASLNIAGNQWSSSVLDMLERHVQLAPQSAYTGTTEVEIMRLDSLDDLSRDDESIYLKIDAQGYELEVLKGSTRTLEACQAVELELTFVPLYAGQALASTLIEWLRDHDFGVAGFDRRVLIDRTGELLEADVVFVRIPSVAT